MKKILAVIFSLITVLSFCAFGCKDEVKDNLQDANGNAGVIADVNGSGTGNGASNSNGGNSGTNNGGNSGSNGGSGNSGTNGGSGSAQTLPVVISQFMSPYSTYSKTQLNMAASVFAMMPVIILFIIFQREIVNSVAFSGMKE